jgi:uncharacterized protein (TIGR02596 family)
MKAVARNGFTLIELLMVLSIMAALWVLVVPAFSSMVMASRVNDAAVRVTGVIALARQTAIAHNHSVEVRFYQCGDPESPGESTTSPDQGKFRALQVFEYNENGMVVPVSKVEWLPGGVIFDSNIHLSTLFDSSQTKNFRKPLDPVVNLPRGVGEGYNCRAFLFTPSGSTRLGFGNWFITLHNATSGDNLETPPPNYATIQVEAVSGAVTTHRP